MKIYASQFSRFLNTQLFPNYLLFGKEPGLVQQNSERLNTWLASQGFEREFILVDNANQFDWSDVWLQGSSPSLFSPRRFFDIYVPQLKTNKEAGQALLKIAECFNPDTIWVLRTYEVESSIQKSAWWQIWEKKGLVVQHPILSPAAFMEWLNDYAKTLKVTLSKDCLLFLCERYQGNLPSAQHALQTLQLAFEDTPISLEQVSQQFKDESLYSVFELCDLALQGKQLEAAKSFLRLNQAPTTLPLLIWALHKTIMELIQLKAAPHDFERYGIWASRKPYYQSALQRLHLSSLSELPSLLFKGDAHLKTGKIMATRHIILNVLLHLSGSKALDFKHIF